MPKECVTYITCTDNGYYSERNLAELFLAHFDFVTLVKTGVKWVKAEIDGYRNEFGSLSSACPFDAGTHGITRTLMREFEKVRKYADRGERHRICRESAMMASQ